MASVASSRSPNAVVRRPRGLAIVTSLVLAVAGLQAVGMQSAAAATVSPVLQRTPANVTADALPTVQIDGVVWSQAIVGDTVYAGGQFSNARPAGAAPGQSLIPRSNLLAFSVSTGNLVTSFAPVVNAEIRAVTRSPDGSRIYIGGSFTTVNGAAHNEIAAFNTATGALVSSFSARLNASVYTLTASNTAVYAGGAFSTANGVARSRLAAFNPADGSLLPWAPSADSAPRAMVVTPDGSHVILGGSFQHISGAAAYGLASVGATDGAVAPFAANQVVRDAGTDAAILHLSTDGAAIYSSAYVFGRSGNFEGNMSADPTTGKINWLADCHGDTYGTFATGNVVYSIGHQHYCANIGGFPDTSPRSIWHHTTAFTTNATGTVKPNGQSGGGYGNFAGQPSPSLINWLPDMTDGTFTGQSQAAWSVTGTSQYVVEGGEFPSVNGVAQQGLVRFAIPSLAPRKQGPRVNGSGITTSLTALSSTSVRVSVLTDWDRDDQNLTYTALRDGTSAASTTAVSQSWNRPTIMLTDNSVTPGVQHHYQVRISDQDGNTALGPDVTITTSGSGNVAPTASFTVGCTQLTCTVNGSGSSDPDGSIAGYSWAFGDGATGAGPTVSHSYAGAGSYTITLTVTDNKGATGSTSHPVSVSVGASTLADDTFNRTVSGGFGTASPSGGSWITTNHGEDLSVTPGAGTISLPAGATSGAYLPSTATSSSNLTTAFSLDKLPDAGGYYVSVLGRRVSSTEQYIAGVKVAPGGSTSVSISKYDGSTTGVTLKAAVNVGTVAVGTTIHVRFQARGASPTQLTAKVWLGAAAEPTSPTVSTTDSSGALQTSGAAGILGYLSTADTNGPVSARLSAFTVSSP